jgi:hypothetical protein
MPAACFNTRSLQGFEVDPFPGVVAFGLIQPWDINVPDNARRCILYSHNAIDTYNTKVGVSFFFSFLSFLSFLLRGKFSIPYAGIMVAIIIC